MIYNEKKYEEGRARAEAISKNASAFLKREIPGFRFGLVGQQFYISAPHDCQYSQGPWNRDFLKGSPVSVIYATRLDEECFNQAIGALKTLAGQVDEDMGYKAGMAEYFPEPSNETPKEKDPVKTIADRLATLDKDLEHQTIALKVAKSLGIAAQVSKRQEMVGALNAKRPVLVAGYEPVSYDSDKFEDSLDPIAYEGTVPLRVLKEWEKAASLGIFHDFRIWIDKDDPLLVGRTQFKNAFKIDEW